MANHHDVVVEDLLLTLITMTVIGLLAWGFAHGVPRKAPAPPRPATCVGRTCPVAVDLDALYEGLDGILDVQHALIHQLEMF